MLAAVAGAAQVSDPAYYNKIDNKIFSYSGTHGTNLDSLTRFVNEKFISDKEKIRAFYTWIALNISYDKALLDSYKLNMGMSLRRLSSQRTQHPDTVIKYRRAVCEGYCLLMNKLCENSAIISKMVIGDTRLEDGEVVDGILHAWNAVKLDTTWYLLDVTWSNGYVDQMNHYKKKFSDKYFFTAPAEFVKDHWPLDPMWQLSHYPISKQAFRGGQANEKHDFFNYKDSIAAFLKLKEDTADYVSFLHYHRFDPGNEFYTREIDHMIHDKLVTYLNLAAVYYDDYQLYAKKYIGRVINEKVVLKFISLLQEPRKYLLLGLAYAKNKTFFHADVKENFEKMTISATQSLKDVDTAIADYRKLARSLKGSKK